MDRLIAINKAKDIPQKYLNTPIWTLLQSHNLNRKIVCSHRPQILISTCMDNQRIIRIPDNFAYMIRIARATFPQVEFMYSYAISVLGVNTIALIAHKNCGMINLEAKKEQFVTGLMRVGWKKTKAEKHFDKYLPVFQKTNIIDELLEERNKLQENYSRIMIVPLFLNDDNKLYLINEE